MYSRILRENTVGVTALDDADFNITPANRTLIKNNFTNIMPAASLEPKDFHGQTR